MIFIELEIQKIMSSHRSQPKPDLKSTRHVQIFDKYSMPFSSQSVVINEDFLKAILGYLYPVANEQTTTQDGADVTCRIMAGTIEDGNGKYLIFGICMLSEAANIVSKSKFDHVPYIFLCNDSRISYWRTEVANYGYTAAELDGQGTMNGVIRYSSTDSFNVLGQLGFISQQSARIPFKSAFLEGKYENIIEDQKTTAFSVMNTLSKTYYFKYPGTRQQKRNGLRLKK